MFFKLTMNLTSAVEVIFHILFAGRGGGGVPVALVDYK